MKKTFKIIVKLGTLSLPSGAVVFFGGDRRRQPRDGTMLDETPDLHASALIQEDLNLISMDGSMHIEIASISWQGWKIETCEPEIMKLI